MAKRADRCLRKHKWHGEGASCSLVYFWKNLRASELSESRLMVAWKQSTWLDRPSACLICHYCVLILPVISLLVVAAVWLVVEVCCFCDPMVTSIHHLNNWDFIHGRMCIYKYSKMPKFIMPQIWFNMTLYENRDFLYTNSNTFF